jgi:acyl-CoA dehydrogenase
MEAEAQRIATEVLARHAADVDAKSRFPTEGIKALAEARLLGALVPVELGGLGATITDLHRICFLLGQQCASTAMVFAMHQIQVACIVRHGLGVPELRRYAQEELAGRQALLASATTEATIGGNVRNSVCAVELLPGGARFKVRKEAPVISYADDADAILVTSRKSPDAPASDQVISLITKKDMKLEKTANWDALGFRGTCSNGYILEAEAPVQQIIPQPYAEVSAQTMLPFSHLTWTSLWTGLGTSALNQARAFIRSEARKRPGTVPPASMRLAEAYAVMQGLRSNVEACVEEYERIYHDTDALSSMGFALRMNNVKLLVSDTLVDLVGRCMRICGIYGYKQDSKFTLGRHLRDAWGAQLMVNNDRIYGGNAQMLLVHKDE